MKPARPVWQKRFAKRPAELALKFTSSLAEDRYLVPYDLECGLAHVRMLARQKIIKPGAARRIERGLRRIMSNYRAGRFRLRAGYEDVHMNVEQRLKELIGPTAEMLHTARSRNDLVATDLRLFVRDACVQTMQGLVGVQKALVKKSEQYFGAVMPGYTHWQQAQPIMISFYLLAHYQRFERDLAFLKDVLKRTNVSPLGACALSGTSLPVDIEYLGRQLGFRQTVANALDGVADRDFIGEFLYGLTQIMIHISGLAEELVMFSSREFGLVELDDSMATGSSIMPQKKNPDVGELLRGKAGQAIGNLAGMLAILKGLSLSYNRDLQEIKSILLRQERETAYCLEMTEQIVLTLSFHVPKSWAGRPNFCCAADLVEHLVRQGWRFRSAYDMVVQCVRKSGNDIEVFIEACSKATGLPKIKIAGLLKPAASVQAKNSGNSTGPSDVRRQMIRARKNIAGNTKYIKRIRVRH